MNTFYLTLISCFTALCLGLPSQADAVRLKDLASIEGVRNNQLIGYGLVVGLNGTGDGNKAAFTTQGLVNMLKNMGIPVNESDVSVSNVAGVMITANLPPFAKAGQTIDVTLSSLGDASSLQGGTLIATPLKGLDEKIYALAQGPVSIGGFAVRGGQTDGAQSNHLTVARIPGGASVEKEVSVSFAEKESINLSLKSPDFTTVSRMQNVIDAYLGGSYATALDGSTVTIKIPNTFKNREIGFLAAIENLEITPDSIAKVVLDERTGTIVMGENVRVSDLALAHGNLSVQVSAKQEEMISGDMVGQIITDDMVRKMTDGITSQGGDSKDGRLINLSSGVTLGELVRALNSVGVSPKDLIAIFQTIKASGALQADLEII